ncbi:replication-relaxation family protein [Paenibacillus sp.]|uniref:replication-relaxation family protein n=1 Tax=Paenibacillus sp. TaxID=58172 RepID=UPI0028119486|nr:replication-relaxation family protein [Paenibacillus sp.]
MSRGQIQRLHGLAGDRNARRVLANMDHLLGSWRCETGETIFYLNKYGRERVGAEKARQKIAQVGHYLMRNDFYIRIGAPESWRNEVRYKVEGVLTIVADAVYQVNGRRHFLEVDHLQTMAQNEAKIEKYRLLRSLGVLQERLKYFPRLVWVTLTEGRRKQLAGWCEGLDVTIHLWDEIR